MAVSCKLLVVRKTSIVDFLRKSNSEKRFAHLSEGLYSKHWPLVDLALYTSLPAPFTFSVNLYSEFH